MKDIVFDKNNNLAQIGEPANTTDGRDSKNSFRKGKTTSQINGQVSTKSLLGLNNERKKMSRRSHYSSVEVSERTESKLSMTGS